MTTIEHTRDSLGGMQVVKRELIRHLQDRGAEVSARNFSWNFGRSYTELPRYSSHMKLKVGGREVSIDWPSEQLRDSATQIGRPDVRIEIQRIVEHLTAPQAA
jgi:hypothetical protein